MLLTAPTISAVRDLSNELFKADENIRRYDTLFVFESVKTGSSVPAELLLR